MASIHPGISVVIPTYNRARRVRRAIDSALAQTCRNFEVIVVDDGSQDETQSVLAHYGRRIRVIRQANKGPAAARNLGIREANHELIAFLDSDDVWVPEKLEIQRSILQDPRVVLSYTNWTDSKDKTGRDYFSSIGFVLRDEPAVVEIPLKVLARTGGCGIWTTTCVCRKSAVLRVGGFDERMRIAEDIRLWFRLAFEGKFAVTGRVLANRGWTDSAEQLTHEHDLAYFRESARARMEVFWETYARAVDSGPDIQRQLRRFVAQGLVDLAKQLALDANYPLARRKAFEALVFLPKGRTALKALVGLAVPSAFRRMHR